MNLRRLFTVCVLLFSCAALVANPWNGKVVLQAFWWDYWNSNYPNDWATYLAKLAPRLRDMGIDVVWIPPTSKGNSGTSSVGYDLFDHYGSIPANSTALAHGRKNLSGKRSDHHGQHLSSQHDTDS